MDQDKKSKTHSTVAKTFSAPSNFLPKGGGAIRGIGEKFSMNPVTGSGSLNVPIYTSPGRSGFNPQLSLTYDSGAGNGPFGIGWNLSLPSITRKTDKGLPQYLEAQESDVFLLSGSEDLVPVLEQNNDSKWISKSLSPRRVDSRTYQIKQYCPRIEGLFAHIERWTNSADPSDTFWRSISKDNITTWYGKTLESRIADPADSTRIFSWLICESHDDKGNVIVYKYKEENEDLVLKDANGNPIARANERNRERRANRYLKCIRYGNHKPYLPQLSASSPWPQPPGESEQEGSKDWFFEVVLDYGEHDVKNPQPIDARDQLWPVRNDPFSSYRSGYEVRTYRLCQRILMFHHFPNELEVGANCLVNSTDFTYSYEKNPTDARNPIYSYLLSVTQTGYKRNLDPSGGYINKSLPPLEFTYTEPMIDTTIREVSPNSLENLPVGMDGTYQWVDLDGEGISGILTEQANGWFYKRNLSPIAAQARFAPVELVGVRPNLSASPGQAQFMDLAGDGQLDLVSFQGAVPGFFERAEDAGWESFQPFRSWPNLNTHDPNLRFVDLNGDGHADIIVAEEDGLRWYPSLAEEGFAMPVLLPKPQEEEKGPALVFADGVQSIYLADLSGDGLSDLVRIRNSEVCYWPNLGYGRFGAKVTMDNSPLFDTPDTFDQKRIRLADIDGSGTTDIIYLHADGVRMYFNQSGNSWSQPQTINSFPPINNITSVTVVDLLGKGTACLVWSSPLPGDGCCPMRYIDLMGDQKPHLLVKTVNNLGAETVVSYVPSTKFYLKDKEDGKAWITKLPFPVHCVEKVTVTDKWRKTEFATTYSYHHGYFDGIEREFRGFGRVEQIDVETFNKFAAGNIASPYITDDQTLYQPPVKIIKWYHTGAFIDRQQILSQFRHEYFQPGNEHELPEPDFEGVSLTTDEMREALRACKGILLRQEVYELDVDALKANREVPTKLFSTVFQNCSIKLVQPMATNRHSVFHVLENESITYHYELDLRQPGATPDPRIVHNLNLNIDHYGNVLESVAVVYKRANTFADDSLDAEQVSLINNIQNQHHLTYTENRYTDDDVNGPDNYRLPLACQARTYELTGIGPSSNGYYTLAQLRDYNLSDFYQTPNSNHAVSEILYQSIADYVTVQKRLIDHSRTLYFAENHSDPMDFGKFNRLGIQYEIYTLALTDNLLDAVFGNQKLTQSVKDKLSNSQISGYQSGSDLTEKLGTDTSGQYWMRSGIAGFAADAKEHFYLPERYTDAFGNVTTLKYDEQDLFIELSTDPLGNTVSVEKFDFRVLAPRQVKDTNDNLSEVHFDILGLPTAMALKGKGNEADNLDGFDDTLVNPDPDTLYRLFTGDYDEAEVHGLLGNATARHLYYFGEKLETNGSIMWAEHPPCAFSVLREKHVAELKDGETSPLQTTFQYSDGMGTALVKKAQAERAENSATDRWIATGKTIFNNKGNTVKQYEPYFSSTHCFEELVETGVSTLMYYDAIGRLIRTEMPDGSYSRVDFSPWHVTSYDQNDTVTEPGNAWYAKMTSNNASAEEKRAAALTEVHGATPLITILDSLGRDVVVIGHNRVEDPAGLIRVNDKTYRDDKYLTFTKLDAEGKPLWVQDARGNLVTQHIIPLKEENDPSNELPANSVACYDIAGNLLFQHSMDTGDSWTLMDAAGNPMFGWQDNNPTDETGTEFNEERVFYTAYDALQRPKEQWLTVNADAPQLIEQYLYGESLSDVEDAKKRNMRGQLYQHYDQSGLKTITEYDFKGNLKEIHRQLASSYKAPVIGWQVGSPTAGLESERFIQITEYDGLNRMSRLFNWHKGTDSRVAVYEPAYNVRGLLEREVLLLRAVKQDKEVNAKGYEVISETQCTTPIRAITYNAKGQREKIVCGNGKTHGSDDGTITRYHYDPQTYRLKQLRMTSPGYDPPFPGNPSPFKNDRVLQDLYYTYDPVGNISAVYDYAYETVFFKNQMVEPRSQYVYDALYRLIEATGRESINLGIDAPGQFERDPFQTVFPIDEKALRNYTQYYTYDSVGNIANVSHAAAGGQWSRSYSYSTHSNRLSNTWLSSDTVNAVEYQYDKRGNMRNLANVDSEYFLRWDYRDMIQSLNRGGGGKVYYNYDSSKGRTHKVNESQAGAKQWEHIYLGGLEIYRKYNGEIVEEEIESIHLVDGTQRLLLVEDVLRTNKDNLEPGLLFRYQYTNHLGSALLELNDRAEIISYEEYHPYGTTAFRAANKAVKSAAKRYRYTNMERDEESGLYYHGARYYASWLGRWMSCDPAGMVDGLNLYAYSQNNPMLYLDSTGTQAEQIELIESIKIPTVALRDEYAHRKMIRKYVTAEAHSWGLDPKKFVNGHSKDTPEYNSPAGKPQIISPQTETSNAKQSVQERKEAQAIKARNNALKVQKMEGPEEFVRDYRKDESAPKNMPHNVKLPKNVVDKAKNYNAAAADQVKKDYLARNDATIQKSQQNGSKAGPAPSPASPKQLSLNFDKPAAKPAPASSAAKPAPTPSVAPASKPSSSGGMSPAPGLMNTAGGVGGALVRNTVPGVAEGEAVLVGAAYYASGSATTAPLVAPLLTAAEAVPIVGGGVVAGGVAGNLYENAATSLGASEKVAKGTGIGGAILTGAAAGAIIGSPTGIGAPIGAVIGGVAGLIGYGLSKWL